MTDIKKRYWTSSEIAKELGVKTYVVCYMVAKKPNLEPKKRLNGGMDGKRLYTEKEMNKVVKYYRA